MDKVWHFVGSAALVVAAYLYQLFFSRPDRPEDYRLMFAAGFSLAVGIGKEVIDATNVLPWCDGDCKFDGWDLLVDLNGVTVAILYIIAGRNLCCSCREQRTQDDSTAASTVAPLEEEKENENAGNVEDPLNRVEQGHEQWKPPTAYSGWVGDIEDGGAIGESTPTEIP